MKLAITMLLSLIVAACLADTDSLNNEDLDLGDVYYFGFEIERITGIPEEEIEDYGCKYKIRRVDFESLILDDLESAKVLTYERRDVRAKVVFGDEVYYIDRSGVINLNSAGTKRIDRDAFSSKLVESGECDNT
jgi:hypothetical protein